MTLVLVVDDYGLKTVQEYMYHIRSNAEFSVRNLLKDVAKRAGTSTLEAVDYLDDGSPVSYVQSNLLHRFIFSVSLDQIAS